MKSVMPGSSSCAHTPATANVDDKTNEVKSFCIFKDIKFELFVQERRAE